MKYFFKIIEIEKPVIINAKEIIDAEITSFSKKSVKKPRGSKVIRVESSGKAKFPCGKKIVWNLSNNGRKFWPNKYKSKSNNINIAEGIISKIDIFFKNIFLFFSIKTAIETIVNPRQI